MILTVDVGNTNVMLGGFDGDRLSFVASLSTAAGETADEYGAKLLSILALHGVERSDINGAILSSVVPQLNSVIREAIEFLYGITPLLVGPGIKTGIGIRCDTPSSVGSDLISAAVAVSSVYKAPGLIVDMGTATKLTVVNEQGAFAGVSILPGVLMGMNALSENTAQLPKVSLEAPPSVIGKNTVDSIRSGIIYGSAATVDGMIDRIFRELGREIPVYATGGLAPIIIPHCYHEITLDEHLVLKGLNVLYKRNN